ncbi:hypothetical protein N7510_000549 [Penicillium lagena]|uniref:uncharacterized protein n=1 Tax=Penicillium lagena TaxID=94218 RepID=UPI00253FF240|nr:uncharacterized protein N7510_000549 [Penicillium lagena]KAJ5624240.1 hypothetical protein N7510_000549 [Penicillium lagena]
MNNSLPKTVVSSIPNNANLAMVAVASVPSKRQIDVCQYQLERRSRFPGFGSMGLVETMSSPILDVKSISFYLL